MTTFNINEKRPNVNQYCFVKSTTGWIFAIYTGIPDEPNKWDYLVNPSEFGVENITEWQPASLNVKQAIIDIEKKTITHELCDVINDENVSFWDDFVRSCGK